MRKVLITGLNSYIGTSFIRWVNESEKTALEIDTISLKDDAWEQKSFQSYDTVIHLAAIVHSPSSPKYYYYTVNRDLSIRLAKKAKKEGVNHFIYFSTLSVYGLNKGAINKDTEINPSNDYGKSKLEAERELLRIEDRLFKLLIVRPPLVYGPRCPGNFSKLVKVFRKIPILPLINNQRSMIYIDNLSKFLYLAVINQITGIVIPQNHQYVSTISIYKEVRKVENKYKVLVPAKKMKRIFEKNETFNKLFGDLTVSKEMSMLHTPYQEITFEESIRKYLKE